MKIITCEFCEKEFYAKSYKPQRFCSTNCAYQAKAKQLKLICTECDKEFTRKLSQVNSDINFCCRSCRSKYTARKYWSYEHADGSNMIYVGRYSTGKPKYRAQQRVVAEHRLNRLLQPHEIVLNINGNKKDVELENLYIFLSPQEYKTYMANPYPISSNLKPLTYGLDKETSK